MFFAFLKDPGARISGEFVVSQYVHTCSTVVAFFVGYTVGFIVLRHER